MLSIHDHLAAAFGRSAADAETALATLVADIHARCRTYGEAAYPGLGTFRLGPDGMGFEPDPALAIVVNHRFAGLGAMPALETAPDTAWAPPPPPVFAPLANQDLAPLPLAEPTAAPEPASAVEPVVPVSVGGSPAAVSLPGEAFMPPGTAFPEPPPTRVASEPAEPSELPDPPVLRSLPPERPERSGRPLLVLPLVLFVVLLLGLAWWASTRWPSTRPDAPAAQATAPLPPDTAGTRGDTLPATLPSVDTTDAAPPAASAAPMRAPTPTTDRAQVLPPTEPRPRQTAPPVAQRPASTPAALPPVTRPAAPAPAASAEDAARRALRGQEPVEAGQGGWTVVIGGAPSEEAAEATARRFRLQGYRTGVLQGTVGDSTAIYRVGLGHFATLAAAQEALNRLRGDIFPADAWLLRLR